MGSEPRWVFWHHWPDCRFEHHGDPGKGLSSLTDEVVGHLRSDGFWKLASRLAEGRRLVVTSDHGYAASGLFPDSDKDQTEYLRTVFKSGRCNGAGQETRPVDAAARSVAGYPARQQSVRQRAAEMEERWRVSYNYARRPEHFGSGRALD